MFQEHTSTRRRSRTRWTSLNSGRGLPHSISRKYDIAGWSFDKEHCKEGAAQVAPLVPWRALEMSQVASTALRWSSSVWRLRRRRWALQSSRKQRLEQRWPSRSVRLPLSPSPPRGQFRWMGRLAGNSRRWRRSSMTPDQLKIWPVPPKCWPPSNSSAPQWWRRTRLRPASPDKS